MTSDIEKVLRAGRSGLVRDAERAGIMIVNELTVMLSQPGRGAVYTTFFRTNTLTGKVFPVGKRPTHRASAPGSPPAADTGGLRASYQSDASRIPGGDVMLEIGTPLKYAAYLEFGTSKMQARPHLRVVMVDPGMMIIRREVAQGIELRQRAMARRLGGRG